MYAVEETVECVRLIGGLLLVRGRPDVSPAAAPALGREEEVVLLVSSLSVVPSWMDGAV